MPEQFVNVPEDGVPKAGVTNVGLVESTTLPEPVEVVTPVPPFATGRVPVTPVLKGSPVQLVNVPEEGVPSAGVTNVGLVANTNAPEPVSPVTAAAKLADEGVAKNVATPEPKPEMPVATGKPVQFVNVPEVGVPNTGATKVGVFANTKAPEPVSSETADAKFALDGVPKKVATPEPRPDTPVEIGKPVQFVNVPEAGVPSAGVVSVGLAIVGEIRWSICWYTLVPSVQRAIFFPAGIVMPVPAAVVLPATVEQ